MAMLIQDEQKDHFKFLAGSTDETIIEICKLALEYLKDDHNTEKYSSTGVRLGKTAAFIQQVVDSIVFFLIECMRRAQVPNLDTLSTFGFSEDQIEILSQFIQKQQDVVRKLLTADHSALHFRDLEWRLETRVASRCLHEQMTPLVTVKLHLDTETINENKDKLLTKEAASVPSSGSGTQRQVVMQIDPGSLRGIIESLDEAILESKSHRTRLFCRAFQH